MSVRGAFDSCLNGSSSLIDPIGCGIEGSVIGRLRHNESAGVLASAQERLMAPGQVTFRWHLLPSPRRGGPRDGDPCPRQPDHGPPFPTCENLDFDESNQASATGLDPACGTGLVDETNGAWGGR